MNKNIEWNGFLKKAVEEYPNEVCGMLFSSKPYADNEYWVVYPIKNVSENKEESWIPDKKQLEQIKRCAKARDLVKIGNIHTHPLIEGIELEEQFLPSQLDLKCAKKFRDIIRGIMVVDKKAIYGIQFHDMYGNKIPLLLLEKVIKPIGVK